jgi:hypothetical protein
MSIPIPAPAERRIRREARSATLRERALALRQAGWTLTAIGVALGLSVTRAYQIVKKAERLSREASIAEDPAAATVAGSSFVSGPTGEVATASAGHEP